MNQKPMERKIPLTPSEKAMIGWDFVLDHVQPITPYGNQRKREIQIYNFDQKNKLDQELTHLAMMKDNCVQHPDIHQKIGFELEKIKDIRPILQKLTRKQILDEIDFYEIKYCLMVGISIQEFYKQVNLSILDINFPSLTDLLNILDPSQARMPTFHFSKTFSPLLESLRIEKRQIEGEIYAILDDNLDSNSDSGLDPNLSSNSRISKEKRQSDLKEQRNAIVKKENAEISSLCSTLTSQIIPYIDLLRDLIHILGYIDFLKAKVTMAMKFSGIRPNITSNLSLKIENMRNPLVESILNKTHRKFTPISVEFSSGVNLITGANMGGKTVSLHTLLLNIILAQCGFFVFADNATISMFSFLGAIIEDSHDLSKGLSSFGAEIVKITQFLNQHEKSTGLLIMDEFARGTNPKEGRLILKSLCRYLQKLPWISVVSTHYDEIADPNMSHFQVVGLRQVDLSELHHKLAAFRGDSASSISLLQDHMDYRLESVTESNNIPTDALNIAQILGLHPEIIHSAKELAKLGKKNDPQQ
ncbi:MAG: MutS-related protein [Promethearchaeota archaeon]